MSDFQDERYALTKNYIMNKNYGKEPYVHKYKENYLKYRDSSFSDINAIDDSATELYKIQSARLNKRFATQNNMDPKKSIDSLEMIEDVLKAILDSRGFETQLKKVNAFKSDEFRIDDKSFWAWSGNEKNREKLFSDADKLATYIEYLDKALSSAYKVGDGTKEELMLMLGKDSVPNVEHFRNLTLLKGDAKADAGLKNLIVSVELLKSYIKNMPYDRNNSTPVNVKNEDAKEIVRRLAGSLNGLQGGFFEIALPLVVNNGRLKINQQLKAQGITVVASEAGVGQGTLRSGKSGKKVVSKSDSKIVISFGNMSASMEVGLNLKSAKSQKDKKGNLKHVANFVSKANLYDMLQRSDAINSDVAYHIANMGQHSAGSGTYYGVVKRKLAALSALEVLSGLGSKDDTSYFIVYTNQVIKISTFLEQLANKEKNLSVSIKGINSSNKSSSTTATERYLESHNNFITLMDTMKLTVSS